MKLLQVIGIGAIIAGAAVVLGQRAAAAISFGRPRAKVMKWDFSETKLLVTIPVNNDGGVSASIDDFTGGIYYGRYRIGNVKLDNPGLYVQAGKTVELLAGVTINHGSLLSELANLITDRSFFNNIYLKGTLQAAGLTVRIEQKISLVS